MQAIVIILLVVAVAAAAPSDKYDARFDNFNAHDLVDNVRLLKAYGNCFLDKGPCTSEGADFKKTIPEALRTSCAKCTPKQKDLVRVVVQGFQEKLPDLWTELHEKEDPNNEFKPAFDRFLEGTD